MIIKLNTSFIRNHPLGKVLIDFLFDYSLRMWKIQIWLERKLALFSGISRQEQTFILPLQFIRKTEVKTGNGIKIISNCFFQGQSFKNGKNFVLNIYSETLQRKRIKD